MNEYGSTDNESGPTSSIYPVNSVPNFHQFMSFARRIQKKFRIDLRDFQPGKPGPQFHGAHIFKQNVNARRILRSLSAPK